MAQVKIIRYEKLVATDKYANHRGVVEMELQAGDDPNAAMQYAKDFLNYHLQPPPQHQQPPQQ